MGVSSQREVQSKLSGQLKVAHSKISISHFPVLCLEHLLPGEEPGGSSKTDIVFRYYYRHQIFRSGAGFC